MDSFASLIAPVTPERFFSDYYGKKHLHVPALGGGRQGLLDWRRLNEILSVSSAWTEPRLKLFIDGRRIAPEHYCDRVPTIDGEQSRVNPRKVQVFLSMGASLVANLVETLTPELRSLARLLERELLGLTGANIYCSFGGKRAFNSHFDTHEVFAIHTEGEKVWRLYEGRADNPVISPPDHPDLQQSLDRQKGRLLQELVMRPGDLLYIPRGQFHDALASSESSLHVTFSVEPRNGRVLLKLLEQEVLNDSAFRAYLPRPDTDQGAALKAHLADLAERLKAMVNAPAFLSDVMDLQQAIQGELTEYTLPETGPLTAYAVVPGQAADISRTQDGWVMRCRAGLIRLDGVQKAAAWLINRPAFTKEELSAWFPRSDPARLAALIDTLLRAGIIVPRGH